MPFRSRQQQKWAFANPAKLGGLRRVTEWSAATNFGNLPERVGKVPKPKRRQTRPPRAGERV